MENATQALLIAAGVLIGILILSLGVYLFHTFGGFAADTQSKVDANQIAQFNAKFLQYVGRTDLTIQDIITVKNYALENNKEDNNYYYGNAKYRADSNNDYIDVFYDFHSYSAKLDELKWLNKKMKYLVFAVSDNNLLKSEMEINIKGENKNPARFKCEVEFNEVSGKVNRVYFYEP